MIKKLLILIVLILLLSSCGTTVYTPKGYYDDNYNYPNYQYGLRYYYFNYDSHLYYRQPLKVYIYIPKNKK